MGNVGYHTASILQKEDDAKIIAILEWDGALVDPNGLDVEDVYKYKCDNKGKVKGYPKAKYIEESNSVLEMACDILIPAAMEAVINQGNAAKIQAKLIGEAANGPVTFAAESILQEKGVVIIPDSYLNAGGVTVSYFEWIKNLSHIRFGRMSKRWEEDRSQLVIQAIEKTGNKVPQDLVQKLGQGADDRLQGGVLLSLEKLDALDAGELVRHRFRNLCQFQIHRQDALAPLRSQRDLFHNVLRVGGVF